MITYTHNNTTYTTYIMHSFELGARDILLKLLNTHLYDNASKLQIVVRELTNY